MKMSPMMAQLSSAIGQGEMSPHCHGVLIKECFLGIALKNQSARKAMKCEKDMEKRINKVCILSPNLMIYRRMSSTGIAPTWSKMVTALRRM